MQRSKAKVNAKGRPIYFEMNGTLDIEKLNKLASDEELLKYFVKGYELMDPWIYASCSKERGKTIRQTLVINDLKGLSMKVFSKKAREYLKKGAKIS
jgi:hypothetical protein